jgi:preprotein translocase subunit SecD
MTDNLRVRGFLVFLFLLFCGIYLLPNVVTLPESYPFNRKKLNYGLDIQGGAHLVYSVDVHGVIAERTERTARALTIELKEAGVDVESVLPNEARDALTIKMKSEADRPKVDAVLKEHYNTTLQEVSSEGKDIQLRYYDAVVEQWRSGIINQAIEVIRNRIDEFGVAEPVIAAQGANRILVQLPGITDPARAKELINKTAKLDFRLVATTMEPAKVAQLVAEAEKAGNYKLGKDGLPYAAYFKRVNDDLKGKLPPNTMVAFEKDQNATSLEVGKHPVLVTTDIDISGSLLEDAFPSQGQYGEPVVSFKFGAEGRKKFGEVTGANVHRQLAVVLDNIIFTAPVINERIDGQGQITLGNRNAEESQKEAQLISTALRAGALPAALQQEEERSVGPSLGSDSIEKGKRAGMIGILLVIIFVSFYYKIFGVVAACCLGLNVLGLLAVLSALGATLTLPGIAGITLTVGMAVDANVIIYERIREEIGRGIGVRTAIKDGFEHAFSAIFDSNVSTGIAAAVLIYFGSGPVRGFGVTLIAGIATTMITAVFVTRYFLDVLVTNSKPSKYWM